MIIVSDPLAQVRGDFCVVICCLIRYNVKVILYKRCLYGSMDYIKHIKNNKVLFVDNCL